MGRSKRQRAKAKAEGTMAPHTCGKCNVEEASLISSVENVDVRGRIAQKEPAGEQVYKTDCRDAENGCVMDAGCSPEFNMNTTPAQMSYDTQSTRASTNHVVQSMDASRMEELSMETRTQEAQLIHQETGADTVPEESNTDAASPEMILAATQLMKEMQLTYYPQVWSDPLVQPLLKEVLNARIKSITRSKARRQNRRANRNK